MIESKKKSVLTNNSEIIIKLTSIWAFSESVLGGFFHAFSLPFSGALLTAIAAVLISLIAYYTENRGEIIKATIIVLLVKLAVSPNTPVTAYFAVSVQGVLGELLFFSKKYFKISTVLFSASVLMLTAIQRILILTILFGNNFWHSLNIYSGYVFQKFNLSDSVINVSNLIIGAYIFLHLVIGLMTGKFASNLPGKIKAVSLQEDFKEKAPVPIKNESDSRSAGKRNRLIVIFIFLFILMTGSYFFPVFGKNHWLELLIMLLRSIIIITLWLNLISPILQKYIRKLIRKKGTPFSDSINKIISSFPFYRRILNYSLSRYRGENFFARIKKSLIAFISLALFSEPE